METAAQAENPAHSHFCVISASRRAYQQLIKAASLLQSPLLLIVRLYWGWEFFQTGKGKLMNHEKVAGFFQSLHIPMPSFSAYLAGTTECLGGLLLLIGLASRLVSLPLIFLLAVAYITADSDALKSIFSDPDKFTGAAEFLFLMACVMVLVFGPGVFSVDWLLGKRSAKRKSSGTNRSAAL
jgi:putative oxidoreductase